MDIRIYTPCLVWVNVYAFSYWVRNSINGFMKIKLNYLKSLFSQWVNEGIMWETFWDDVDVIRRVYRNPFVTSYNGNNNLMNLNNHDQSNYSFWIFIRRHQYTLESSRFSCYINWIKDQNIFNQNYIKQAYIAKFQYVCKCFPWTKAISKKNIHPLYSCLLWLWILDSFMRSSKPWPFDNLVILSIKFIEVDCATTSKEKDST